LPHDVDGRLRVGGSPEAADLRLPIGDGTEQHPALADPFDTGHLDRSADRDRRLDNRHGSITGAATTPYPCASSNATARSASASPATRMVSVPPRSADR